MKCNYKLKDENLCKRQVKKGEKNCWQHLNTSEEIKEIKSPKPLKIKEIKSPKIKEIKSPKPVKIKEVKSPKIKEVKSPKPPKIRKARTPKVIKTPKIKEIREIVEEETKCNGNLSCEGLEKIMGNQDLDWSVLSTDETLLKDYIEKNKDDERYKWNYKILSENNSLTKEFVIKNLHKEWNWHYVSKKYGIGVRSPRLVNIIEESNQVKYYIKYINDTYEDAGSYLF